MNYLKRYRKAEEDLDKKIFSLIRARRFNIYYIQGFCEVENGLHVDFDYYNSNGRSTPCSITLPIEDFEK
jgi:hypothetical protein